MSPFQFLKQLGSIPRPGGDGIRVTKFVPPEHLKTSAGLVLTAATAPTIVNVETNAIGITVAAGQTAGGSFTFEVPKDYDTTADELKLNIVAVSGGTDVPTLTATAYRKRAGAALTAALTVTASAAIPTATAKAAERTIILSANTLLAGDILTINIVTGAHATDSVVHFGVEVQYKSALVFVDPTTR